MVVKVFVVVDVDVMEVLLAVVLVVLSVDVVVGGAGFPIIIPNHNISLFGSFIRGVLAFFQKTFFEEMLMYSN